MKKICIILTAAAVFILTLSCAAPALEAPNFCGVTGEMVSAGFWIKHARGADRHIMTADSARDFSAEIRRTPKTYCADVLEYPDIISADRLRAELKNFSVRPSAQRFDGGVPASQEFWKETEANAAADKIGSGPAIVRFAAAADNAALKALPTDRPLYSEPNDALFDMNAESTVKTWEPLAVLHASADGRWLFVVSKSAQGWMHADKAAFADRKTLRELASRGQYIVTGSRVTTETASDAPDAPRRELVMGTMLPKADAGETVGGITTLYGRAVLLPERSPDGTLVIKEALIPLAADVNDGYLPYTQANVVKQAFKMLGERYGWGGMFGARDCSAFIRDIYLTFGIELPRNSRSQTRIPSVHFDTAGMSAAEKEKILRKAPAGALIQMPGHIMLYLGTVKGKPYIIHDAYALGPSGSGGAEGRKRLNSVVITDMEMTRKDGSRVIDNIANINIIR